MDLIKDKKIRPKGTNRSTVERGCKKAMNYSINLSKHGSSGIGAKRLSFGSPSTEPGEPDGSRGPRFHSKLIRSANEYLFQLHEARQELPVDL